VDLYYTSSVFAFPPVWNEGFGLSPVEAMAAATPMIATESGALPETIVQEHTGLLVAKNDVPSFTQALTRLSLDGGTAEYFGTEGRRRVLNKFTWAAIAKRTAERYERLCESTPARTKTTTNRRESVAR
jgi:glycosyltransferase involved in cell wall biosynthesis